MRVRNSTRGLVHRPIVARFALFVWIVRIVYLCRLWRRVPIAVLESLLTIGEVVLQVLSEELSAHSIGLPFRWGLPPLADTVG